MRVVLDRFEKLIDSTAREVNHAFNLKETHRFPPGFEWTRPFGLSVGEPVFRGGQCSRNSY